MYSSFANVATAPRVNPSAAIPPSVKYFDNAATSASTFLTAVATVGDERLTLRTQTALSAVAVVFADPVTVIPSLLREAKPDPTCINPPPIARDMITAATIIVIALRRSTVMIGLSLS